MATTQLDGRKVLEDGTVICTNDTLVEILYSGKNLSGCFIDDKDEVSSFAIANTICDSLLPAPEFTNSEKYSDINWNEHWSTPEPFLSINLKDWCYEKCKTDEERTMIDIEIEEFESRNMMPAIRHLIYCVDVWRKNNVFWGVGRGSSVSSFVLYLIGINRINPLKYSLDLNEWLK